MKHLVFMSPNNGQLVVGKPLYGLDGLEPVTAIPEYCIGMFREDKPLAYVIEADKLMTPTILAAAWVEKKMICLGDL